MLDKSAVNAIVIGAVLVALGLIPGPLARLRDGLQNFRDFLAPFAPITPQPQTVPDSAEKLPGQIWVAVGGAVAMAIGILALILN